MLTKVSKLMLAEASDSEAVVSVRSRAYAVSDFHPEIGPDVIVTRGYFVEGDLGGASYKQVGSEPSHAGKFSIATSGGATAWYALAETMPIPEMFGAKGDDPGNGTGTDDRQAIQNLINFSRRVYLSANRTYRIHGGLTLPRFQQIIGLGGRSATNFWIPIGQTGASRFIFTGSAVACWSNQDSANMLSHGSLRGFDMRAEGTYSYMMLFREALQWHLSDIGMETDSPTTHGIHSLKIAPANPSWANLVDNVSVRLPDASDCNTIDIDWSDSVVRDSHLTGGVGAMERGHGTRFLNNQIERSKHAGLTIRKTGGLAVKNTIAIGNSFDANRTYGILFEVAADTSGTTRFATVISGNNFRTEDPNTAAAGVASIGFTNPGGATYTVGPIVGNIELRTGVPQKSEVGTWSIPSNVGNMQA